MIYSHNEILNSKATWKKSHKHNVEQKPITGVYMIWLHQCEVQNQIFQVRAEIIFGIWELETGRGVLLVLWSAPSIPGTSNIIFLI